ncbi:MAG: dihydroxyacetone kinase subunit L [Bifidobacteriaceae bacterium]|jgi:dihydroxyacetone kinase-like protein|nr:dihydroxyacetone kinase subunit L [Bifidobacteriaceae bacterium]
MADVLTVPGVAAWLHAFRERIDARATYLTELDSAIGDGDHGVNMRRGMVAVDEALAPAVQGGEISTVGAAFQKVAMTLVSTVGGASGPLYGTMFLRMATGLGDVTDLDSEGVTDAFARGLEGLRSRGKALAGDKTMIDALTPAVDAMRSAVLAGETLPQALAAASAAADAGRDATIPMLARKGRASYLAERSIGHQDPGATSMALLIEAAAHVLGP